MAVNNTEINNKIIDSKTKEIKLKKYKTTSMYLEIMYAKIHNDIAINANLNYINSISLSKESIEKFNITEVQ